MVDIADTSGSHPTRKRSRHRWLKRCFLTVLFLTTVSVMGYGMVWKYNRYSGQREIDAITAKLDSDDPGWRLDDIVATHNSKVPSPESNSALRAIEIVDKFPQHEADSERSPQKLFGSARDGKPLNELPKPDAWKELESQYPSYELGISKLRLWNTAGPRGRIAIEYPEGNPLDIQYTKESKMRTVAFVLAWDAARSALRGQTEAALESNLSLLRLSHQLDFQPFVISHLIRLALVGMALNPFGTDVGMECECEREGARRDSIVLYR